MAVEALTLPALLLDRKLAKILGVPMLIMPPEGGAYRFNFFRPSSRRAIQVSFRPSVCPDLCHRDYLASF